MDSHTHSSQVDRLVMVDTGRRRRWTEDEKLRIVMESLDGARQASATARRYGISPSLLFSWRRTFEVERRGPSEPRPGFVPAVVVPEKDAPRSTPPSTGRMVIVVGNGRRVIVGADVNATALGRVIEVLERR